MSSQRILDTGKVSLTELPQARVPKNIFDLSHDVKQSMDFGVLAPCFLQETLPGDHFNVTPEAFLRLQPMLAPMMQRANFRTEWFFVPSRILWPNWENFISPPKEGMVTPAAPFISNLQVTPNSLGDYLGLPSPLSPDHVEGQLDKVSALPFAAYQKIYDDWYRDEDLEDPIFHPLVDGDQGTILPGNELVKMRSRHWDRDYFTLNKPWPQKGVDVTVPVEGGGTTFDVPVYAGSLLGDNSPITFASTNGEDIPFDINDSVEMILSGTDTDRGFHAVQEGTSPDFTNQKVYPVDLKAATSLLGGGSVTGGTINQLRQAEALQKFLEADSRGGTRYTETIKQHFNTHVPDDTLQRPDYLGKTIQNFSISEVLQTSATDSSTPQGNMAGHGVSGAVHDTIRYHCVEHGYIIGICSAMPTTSYYEGVHKLWNRFDRLDYPWPLFANIGEQETLNREVAYDYGDPTSVNDTFGYLPRYTEMRTMYNRLAGDFRTSLLFWTMARDLGTKGNFGPVLNNSFITVDTADTDRVFAVPGSEIDNVQHLLAHIYFKVKVLRPLPLQPRPTI